MKIQRCDPLEAQHAFVARLHKNVIYPAVVFAAIFSLAFFFFNLWIVGGAALLASAGVFIYLYLTTPVIFIECPSCRKEVDTRTAWECGHKQCRNENPAEFPFIYKCEHCKAIQKTYQCHHCDRLIYLTPDPQKDGAAKALKFLKPVPPPVKTVTVVIDPTKDKALKHQDEIAELQHIRDKGKILKEIKEIENPQPVRTEVQAITDRIRRSVESGESLIALEAQLLAEARTKYRDDHEQFEKAERNILDVFFKEKERKPESY